MTRTSDQEKTALGRLRRMNKIVWSTNWSELPPEAERHAEQAYEHISKAIEITEDAE